MPTLVLIPDRFAPPPDIERSIFGEDAEIILPRADSAREVPDDLWRSADALLVWHSVDIDPDVVAKLERCRVIVRIGAGVDNVSLPAAGARRIPVCNVPDYGTNDVADHALALLLALRRGLFAYDAAVRGGRWGWQIALPMRRITGHTLGIIGLGRIGTATGLRAKALGMRVVFHDPYKEDGYDKALGLERAFELPELLGQADAISFHVPLTDETKSMADDGFFSRIRPGAVLINTARGAVVDLDALERALRVGRVSAAGLDVFSQEPPDPGHPLIKAWRAQEEWIAGRLIITPHAAFYNDESYAELRRKAAQEALRVLQGQPPRNCVNMAFLKQA